MQGAFWPMYDRLLTMARDRAPGELDRIAQELGLDMARFCEDLLNRAHADRIWVHVRGGRENGVSATPWLFLEGVTYVRADALEADLRAALAVQTDAKK